MNNSHRKVGYKGGALIASLLLFVSIGWAIPAEAITDTRSSSVSCGAIEWASPSGRYDATDLSVRYNYGWDTAYTTYARFYNIATGSYTTTKYFDPGSTVSWSPAHGVFNLKLKKFGNEVDCNGIWFGKGNYYINYTVTY